jgi:hypothetical protein
MNSPIIEFEDLEKPLINGGIGFVLESGTQFTQKIVVS